MPQVSTEEFSHMGKLQMMWHMECVPLVQPNHSQKPLVKASQTVVNTRSFAVAGLCFSSRGGLRGKILNLRRCANTWGLLVNRIQQTTLLGFISHRYHAARFLNMVFYVSVY